MAGSCPTQQDGPVTQESASQTLTSLCPGLISQLPISSLLTHMLLFVRQSQFLWFPNKKP